MSLLSTLDNFTHWSGVYIVDFEEVNAGWYSYFLRGLPITDSGFSIWVKVFKTVPSKICGRQPDMVCLGKSYNFKFFKGCLPQILICPFLNTLFFTL